MAEILVVSQDRPVAESWGKWRQGEPVLVRPDGWDWGTQELNTDKFVVIEVPGVSEEDLSEFLQEDIDELFPGEDPPKLHRRRFVLPPQIITAAIASGGRVSRGLANLIAQRIDRREQR